LADLVSDETPPLTVTICDGLALKSTTMVVGGTAVFHPGATSGGGSGGHGFAAAPGGPGFYSDHVFATGGYSRPCVVGEPGPAPIFVPFKASTGQYGVLETLVSGDGIPYTVGGGNTQSSAPPPVSKDKPSESKEVGSW
jgi:hypothetical protein